jgi:hypothetical protein
MDPDNPECYTPSQSLQQSVPQEAERDHVPEQAETTVMAALDGTGAHEQLVIADTARDDAWVAVNAAESLSLEEWR